jgi:hypothetical protein
MQLLLEFDRGYLSKQKDADGNVHEVVKRERIKCRLWFTDTEELNAFLKEHRPIPLDNRLDGDKTKVTSWVNFTTMTKEQLGIK